ncbi:hypothetical protein Trydic_g5987 [Trypoxylus dichotomus]
MTSSVHHQSEDVQENLQVPFSCHINPKQNEARQRRYSENVCTAPPESLHRSFHCTPQITIKCVSYITNRRGTRWRYRQSRRKRISSSIGGLRAPGIPRAVTGRCATRRKMNDIESAETPTRRQSALQFERNVARWKEGTL